MYIRENKNIKNNFRLWLPVFLWCGLIYYFSSMPSLKSDFSNDVDFVLRKIAHMSEYGILTFLFFRASIGQKLYFKKAIVYSVIFSIVFAVTDEYHQLFVYGREGSLRDIFIDSLGVFFVAFLIYKKGKK
ncbi:MAG: VanZ family protein [Candidatus Pacebacteria bacterium]|nr:VanZ family protein [Candidatus Paceibacterota bacterium]